LGAYAHDHEREHEHLLAADLVAVVAEDRAADRTGEEADAERRERRQRGDHRRGVGEEQLVEDERGDRAVEHEVVGLDDGADGARDGELGDRDVLACVLAGDRG
jgi:hypothetical protein